MKKLLENAQKLVRKYLKKLSDILDNLKTQKHFCKILIICFRFNKIIYKIRENFNKKIFSEIIKKILRKFKSFLKN